MAPRHSSDPFGPLNAALADLPREFPALRRVLVGLSGGVDSTALLLAAADTLRSDWELGAVHVNHGIDPAAGQWEAHCRNLCEQLGIPLIIERVTVPAGRHGPEAAARAARFDVFARAVDVETALLLAHHRDDQAETFVLRAMRGSGPDGLRSMFAQRPLGDGLLLRPLLDVPRSLLVERVRADGIEPVVDPMNADPALERAMVRQRVLPELERQRPGVAIALARSASLCGEAREVGDWFARREINARLGSSPSILSLVGLSELPGAVQRQLLRTWLRDRGVLPPPRVRLVAFLEQLMAPPDASVCLALGSAVLRRYGEALFMTAATPAPPSGLVLEWSGPSLELPAACGRLEWLGRGSNQPVAPDVRLTVKFRQGGERLRCSRDGSHRSLKALLQARRIPPWERGRIPLIEHEGHLVLVPGVWEHPDWRRLIDAFDCEPAWVSPCGLGPAPSAGRQRRT